MRNNFVDGSDTINENYSEEDILELSKGAERREKVLGSLALRFYERLSEVEKLRLKLDIAQRGYEDFNEGLRDYVEDSLVVACSEGVIPGQVIAGNVSCDSGYGQGALLMNAIYEREEKLMAENEQNQEGKNAANTVSERVTVTRKLLRTAGAALGFLAISGAVTASVFKSFSHDNNGISPDILDGIDAKVISFLKNLSLSDLLMKDAIAGGNSFKPLKLLEFPNPHRIIVVAVNGSSEIRHQENVVRFVNAMNEKRVQQVLVAADVDLKGDPGTFRQYDHSYEGLKRLLKDLSGMFPQKENILVFFYITGHGNEDELKLNGDTVTYFDLIEKIKRTYQQNPGDSHIRHPKNIYWIFVMDQCGSGILPKMLIQEHGIRGAAMSPGTSSVPTIENVYPQEFFKCLEEGADPNRDGVQEIQECHNMAMDKYREKFGIEQRGKYAQTVFKIDSENIDELIKSKTPIVILGGDPDNKEYKMYRDSIMSVLNDETEGKVRFAYLNLHYHYYFDRDEKLTPSKGSLEVLQKLGINPNMLESKQPFLILSNGQSNRFDLYKKLTDPYQLLSIIHKFYPKLQMYFVEKLIKETGKDRELVLEALRQGLLDRNLIKLFNNSTDIIRFKPDILNLRGRALDRAPHLFEFLGENMVAEFQDDEKREEIVNMVSVANKYSDVLFQLLYKSHIKDDFILRGAESINVAFFWINLDDMAKKGGEGSIYVMSKMHEELLRLIKLRGVNNVKNAWISNFVPVYKMLELEDLLFLCDFLEKQTDGLERVLFEQGYAEQINIQDIKYQEMAREADRQMAEPLDGGIHSVDEGTHPVDEGTHPDIETVFRPDVPEPDMILQGTDVTGDIKVDVAREDILVDIESDVVREDIPVDIESDVAVDIPADINADLALSDISADVDEADFFSDIHADNAFIDNCCFEDFAPEFCEKPYLSFDPAIVESGIYRIPNANSEVLTPNIEALLDKKVQINIDVLKRYIIETSKGGFGFNLPQYLEDISNGNIQMLSVKEDSGLQIKDLNLEFTVEVDSINRKITFVFIEKKTNIVLRTIVNLNSPEEIVYLYR